LPRFRIEGGAHEYEAKKRHEELRRLNKEKSAKLAAGRQSAGAMKWSGNKVTVNAAAIASSQRQGTGKFKILGKADDKKQSADGSTNTSESEKEGK
jgi:hypothetical protein